MEISKWLVVFGIPSGLKSERKRWSLKSRFRGTLKDASEKNNALRRLKCKELDIIVAVACSRWRGTRLFCKKLVDGRTSVRLVVFLRMKYVIGFLCGHDSK
ncbi:hypothetical protein AVEN_9098-1 [Araneus ventricosus]|uniref:Uncharacterized protein n=1 Tax=Araneus ventricosus TaxID=182803 RepID=A0A4Y2GQS4_ARAVE|nr:hypothetical protein AVEN_9098-1 [Araneus ventricosus]